MDVRQDVGAARTERSTGVTRRSALRWVGGPVVGTAAVTAVGAAAASVALGRGAPALSHRDREVVEFLARLEQMETSFYAQAVRAHTLSGEPRQFAETLARQERDHLHDLADLLGGHAPAGSRTHFGTAFHSNASFVSAAVTLEDTVLAAYNGQAENLSRRTLGRVARIMSVESRHAAWARGMAGKLPAPVAADVPLDADAVMRSLRSFIG